MAIELLSGVKTSHKTGVMCLTTTARSPSLMVLFYIRKLWKRNNNSSMFTNQKSVSGDGI